MRCPYCKQPLQLGKQREFENLNDHVTNPNAEHYPLRPTWECSCSDAVLQFWDQEGYVYSLGVAIPKNALDSFAEKT